MKLRNNRLLYKFNYITGDVIKSYGSIRSACIDNDMTYAKIYKMLQQKVLQYPRDDFYFGYEPKPRYVIKCFDNETLELIGVYKTLKEASECTGVGADHIGWQCRKDLPIDQNRIKGCTTMFFKKELIMT